jgi:hypothetical protein
MRPGTLHAAKADSGVAELPPTRPLQLLAAAIGVVVAVNDAATAEPALASTAAATPAAIARIMRAAGETTDALLVICIRRISFIARV